MDGFFAVIFLASVFYSGKVILDSVSYESAVSPRIAFLSAESVRIEEEAEREAVYRASLLDRIQSLRRDVQTLRDQAQDVRRQVDIERHREARLQIVLYKRRIRVSRRVLVP